MFSNLSTLVDRSNSRAEVKMHTLVTTIFALLLFQTPTHSTVLTDPGMSLNSWLVIAGLVIIFFCLVTVIIPNFIKPQEFNLTRPGISMKVSILTVFVLMGFVLSLSSFALQWRGYVREVGESAQKIAELNDTVKQLKTKIEEKQQEDLRARKFDMGILLKPKGENSYISYKLNPFTKASK